MITFLRGAVREAVDQVVVIEVSGVGFSLMVPDAHVFRVSQVAEIFTYLHWNPEQGPALYGFHHQYDRTAFLLIISCPGIGPKLALALLKNLPASAFFSAIITGNVRALSSVSGVGAKKAETLVLQLKDKIEKMLHEGIIAQTDVQSSHVTEVSQALQALQYTRYEVQQVMNQLTKQEGCEKWSFDELMRKALALLAKNK